MTDALPILIIVALVAALKISQFRRADRYRNQQMNRDAEQLAVKARRNHG